MHHHSDRSTRIKILHVLPSADIGGAERMVQTLIREIDVSSFDTSVCIVGGGPFQQELQSLNVNSICIRPYIGKWDIGFLIRLIRIIWKARPRLIHCHIWLTCYYSSLAGLILGIPVVSTLHSNYKVESWFERFSISLIRFLSSSVVMVSDHQLKHFKLVHHLPDTMVIQNGVRLPPLGFEGPHRECLCREIGLNPGEKIITFVGNLRPVKGHIFLLEAIKSLPSETRPFQLLLVGGGPLRTELENKCVELGIAHKVKFLGPRNDVSDILAMTDIFVSSSLSETVSYAIMEAMAMAKPIVATDVGGNGELIRNGVDGLLLASRDPAALSGALASLLNDDDYALSLGANARQRIAQNFTSAAMTIKYQNLYTSLFDESYRKSRTV